MDEKLGGEFPLVDRVVAVIGSCAILRLASEFGSESNPDIFKALT
jgi:hypothetical protein